MLFVVAPGKGFFMTNRPKFITLNTNKKTNKLLSSFCKDLFYNIYVFGGWIYVLEMKGETKTRKYFTLQSLLRYEPPKDRDVYFGTFVRKTRISGKAENCTYTNTIWIDIDDNSLEKIKDLIKKYKIPEPSAYVKTGGHSGKSFHLYWFLNKPCKYAEVKGILTGIGTKLGSDPRARDIARIMRLPGSKHNKDTGQGGMCEVIELSEKRYTLEDFKEFNHFTKERKRSETLRENLKLLLDKVDWSCIKSMLGGVPEGERNFALYRIVSYLKLKRYYSRDKVKQIVKEWNEVCKPPQDIHKLLADFKAFWESEYKIGCKIPDPDQQRILAKYCRERECPIGNFFKVERDQSRDIPINNRIFYDNFKRLSGNAILIMEILTKFKEGLDFNQLREKLTNTKTGKLCFCERVIRESVRELKSGCWITIRPANRKKGLPAFYKYKWQGSFGKGETLFSFGAVLLAVNRVITPTALKLYLVLCKYSQTNRTSKCYPSQKTLAIDLGVSRQNIQHHLRSLVRENFISKSKIFLSENYEVISYRCLV